MLKKFVKALARPFTRRLFWRVDSRISDVAVPMQKRLDAIELDVVPHVEALKGYVPILLNTISSQNAAAREAQRRDDALLRRIEELEAELGRLRTAADSGQHDRLLEVEAVLERRRAEPR